MVALLQEPGQVDPGPVGTADDAEPQHLCFRDDDDLVYGDSTLQIPHIDMQNRLFVLEPVCEIEPGYIHPVLNRTVLQLLNELREKEN